MAGSEDKKIIGYAMVILCVTVALVLVSEHFGGGSGDEGNPSSVTPAITYYDPATGKEVPAGTRGARRDWSSCFYWDDLLARGAPASETRAAAARCQADRRAGGSNHPDGDSWP